MAGTVEKIFILGFLITGIRSSCIFPEFLQSPSEDGSLKPWSTRMWWLNLRHVPKWVEKQDVFIEGAWVWRHRDNNLKSCDRVARKVYYKSSFGHCSERRLVYNRTCLASEGYNKFRVVQYDTDSIIIVSISAGKSIRRVPVQTNNTHL
ncbi:uncharacterized protein LOC121374688 [Gigantopelta aegis]|uniref:uncharacterized protein LOC121374688 n=1 Tax=Gigantopelta aegis TaxID=1735272 RepID=UPI001B88C229|nr:uncharacterized protein LOC121374688 [Gigantopelta aegis]